MIRRLSALSAFAVFLVAFFAHGEAASPLEMCSRLEARMAAGDGVTLPEADRELARFAGSADLEHGDWPAAFAARAGETIRVAMSPLTGCYEFFDESGAVFWTVVPVLPTTENWVASFRHAEEGAFPDDALYAPWRLVDVWFLSHAEASEFDSHAENAESLVSRLSRSSLVARGAAGPTTNLCFTAFSYTETNLFFTAAWPTNAALPESVLDLYGITTTSSTRAQGSTNSPFSATTAEDGASPRLT